jgi:hypothetical protein
VPSFPLQAAALSAAYGGAFAHLAKVLTSNGNTDLIGFSREIEPDDADGPDPLLFNVRILLPNTPLSGLARLRSQFMIPAGSTLAHLMQAQADSWLSTSVRLREGEWYSRFFYEIEGVHPSFVQTNYLITQGLPGAPWSLGCPVLVDGSVAYNELRQLASQSSPTGLWLRELTLERFDEIVAEPSAWTAMLGTLDFLSPDLVFVAFAFASTIDPMVLLAMTHGASADLVAEECATYLAPLRRDQVAAHRVLNAVFGRFPYTFPQMGATASVIT